MNSKHRLEIILPVLATGTINANDRLDHERSQSGIKVQQSDQEYAQRILDAMGKLESVEDMIFFEQSLQKMDLLKAKPGADRNSIIAAQQHYEQFALTVEQLRNNTDSYFLMNKTNIKSKGDPSKVLKSNSFDFLTSNMTRMQNRRQFASESESKVWDARIAMAKKTGEMFKTLHNNLAANFERKQKIKTEFDARQQQQHERNGRE